MKRNARKVVLDVLNKVDKGDYVSGVMQDIYKLDDLSDLDRNFISKIVYGVLEQRIYLDYVIRHFSSVRLKKIDGDILNILRMGVYQFVFMDKVPDSAVVNESVKLAKKASHRHSGFVNALLRNLMREGLDGIMPDKAKDPIKYYSVKYAHPEWMVSQFIRDFGETFAVDLMVANNESPKLTIRNNSLCQNREDLMTKLREMKIDCDFSDIVEDGLVIDEGKQMNLLSNKLFLEGKFTVQDESSMMVTQMLDPQPGERILDLCAAPGGKASHIGQRLKGQGQVVACDVSQNKIDLIHENIKRLNISGIITQINDGLVLNETLVGAFDRVLLDAPCSGLGIIRRKPDIKFNRQETDGLDLQEVQKTMMSHAGTYVKDQGILVYSTCTIDPRENDQVIEWFLSEHKNFVLDQSIDVNPLKLYPNVDETDGFYCCRLKKIGV